MISLALSRVTRWSLLAVGLLLPVAAGVLVRLANDRPAAERLAGPAEPAPTPCDPSRLDLVCPDDRHCVAGICRPLRLAARRWEGEPCTEDLCAAGLECFNERCLAPERLPVAPEVCRGGATHMALENLRSRCASALGQVDAPLTACTEETWEGLSSRDPTFEAFIEVLPRKFSVHFPQGEPGPRGTWLTAGIEGYYLQQLEQHHAALMEARAIFVIGRASVEGSAELNRALSERRTAVIARLLRAELGPTAPPVHVWALASDDALSPERFQANMSAAAVAWDATTVGRIHTMLQTDLAEQPGSEWQWLHAVINRVVLVVPIYCDGREYHPTASFAGAGTTARPASAEAKPDAKEL